MRAAASTHARHGVQVELESKRLQVFCNNDKGNSFLWVGAPTELLPANAPVAARGQGVRTSGRAAPGAGATGRRDGGGRGLLSEGPRWIMRVSMAVVEVDKSEFRRNIQQVSHSRHSRRCCDCSRQSAMRPAVLSLRWFPQAVVAEQTKSTI